MEHLLLECSHARAVWLGVNVNINSVYNNCASVSEWMSNWFSQSTGISDDKWLFTLMIGSWIIWKDRCDSVFQEVTLNPHNSVLKINYHLSSHMHNSFTSVSSDIVSSHWRPPAPDILKINVDASFSDLLFNLGTGLIIRDSTGVCWGIRGSYTNGVLNPEEGECMAVREALAWAKEKQYTRIHIEADAKLVIQSLNSSCLLIKWENRNLLKEIKHLSQSFSYCQFSFVGRDDNQVADAVAKSVRTSGISLEQYNNFSAEFCSLLAKDNISSSS